MTTVELHPAFIWTCDDCGRDSFGLYTVLVPESVDLDDLPEYLDAEAIREWIDGGGEGHWLTAPKRVRCGHCGSTFETQPV